MNSSLNSALSHLTMNQDSDVRLLLDFIEIPSISNAPGYDSALLTAAHFLSGQIRASGIEGVALLKVGKHVPPLITAWDDSAGTDAPLVVIYGHYDVQPEGSGWTMAGAFAPKVTNGRIYGRGSGDNKGPVMAIVRALRSWKIGAQRLPVRVRIIFEGQEENGSRAIQEYLATEDAATFLRGASSVLVCDTLAAPDGQPSITFGLRGMAYFRLKVFGPARESHSGHVGGAVQDPGEALSHLLASLRDPKSGELLVPGLWTSPTPLTAEEAALLALSPVSAASIQLETGGVPGVITVQGRTIAEQVGALPALTVHSLCSGNLDEETAATNVPTVATAKFSLRLVPGLDPDSVEEAVRRHLNGVTEDTLRNTVRIELTRMKGSQPVRFNPVHPQFAAVEQAMVAGWGMKPIHLLAGGSIPVIGPFAELLNAPIFLWGGTNADSNFHGPDENLTVHNYHCTACGLVHLFGLLATVPSAA